MRKITAGNKIASHRILVDIVEVSSISTIDEFSSNGLDVIRTHVNLKSIVPANGFFYA